MEVHELLSEFGFDENTPIITGSALYALEASRFISLLFVIVKDISDLL